jgi:hypothetical protein
LPSPCSSFSSSSFCLRLPCCCSPPTELLCVLVCATACATEKQSGRQQTAVAAAGSTAGVCQKLELHTQGAAAITHDGGDVPLRECARWRDDRAEQTGTLLTGPAMRSRCGVRVSVAWMHPFPTPTPAEPANSRVLHPLRMTLPTSPPHTPACNNTARAAKVGCGTNTTARYVSVLHVVAPHAQSCCAQWGSDPPGVACDALLLRVEDKGVVLCPLAGVVLCPAWLLPLPRCRCTVLLSVCAAASSFGLQGTTSVCVACATEKQAGRQAGRQAADSSGSSGQHSGCARLPTSTAAAGTGCLGETLRTIDTCCHSAHQLVLETQVLSDTTNS